MPGIRQAGHLLPLHEGERRELRPGLPVADTAVVAEHDGEVGGVVVLDDYGHHPTEIAATLRAAKECWPERRLVVVFQPHRYTRTRDSYEEFVISFNQADLLIIAPVYAAGEEPIMGIDSGTIYYGIKEHGHRAVTLCTGDEEIMTVLLNEVKPGDIVLTLGAGDIYRIGMELLEHIEA